MFGFLKLSRLRVSRALLLMRHPLQLSKSQRCLSLIRCNYLSLKILQGNERSCVLLPCNTMERRYKADRVKMRKVLLQLE